MMNNIWVSSDLHLCHARDFIYEPRGFENVQEHNETIIENWNEIVAPDDDVYLLGDLMLNDNEHGMECLGRLNGRLHLVRGNHETDERWKLYPNSKNVVELCGWATQLRISKQSLFLSHYPTITSNCDADKPLKARVLNLCGHSHTKDPFADWDKGLIFHCELDTNNCRPWNYEDIIKKVKEKLGE